MKLLRPLPILALALAAVATISCVVDRAAVARSTPDLLEQYDSLVADAAKVEAQVQEAEGLLSEALLTPEPEDDEAAAELLAESNRKLQDIDARLAAIEERVIRNEASPLSGALPYGLGALGVELIATLGSSRKRKLYKSAFSQLTKGQVYTTAGEILKALGVKHSAPPPAPPEPAAIWNAPKA